MKYSKILAFLLAFCLVASLAPCALADDETSGTCGENLTWVLEDGVLTISGTGDMDDFLVVSTTDFTVSSIPWDGSSVTSVVLGNNVSSIGDYAFYECSNLKSITLPDNVTSIGDYAFYDCYRLKDITFPNNVTRIGNYAFWCCLGLENIAIPDSVTSIGGSAFAGCARLTNLTMSDGVANIGNQAFLLCVGLTSITIPDSVNFIEYAAFSGCTSLTDVYYGGNADEWNAIEIGWGNEYLTSATIHYNSTASASTPANATGFGDVDASDYCYTPVAWALEQGITTGTTTTTFSPSETCTRGQIVTFLYRALA